MAWSQEEINEVAGTICQKAVLDPEFRKIALSDPAAAIKAVSDKDIPAGFGVNFVENAPGVNMTIVIPDALSEELSDDELERVAGGSCAQGNCAEACGANASTGDSSKG